MLNVLVGPDRISTALAAGSCAFDAVGDKARQVVVARVNGEVVDLSHELAEGDHVESILISDPIGLSVLRHSVAHLVAQATQVVFPGCKTWNRSTYQRWLLLRFWNNPYLHARRSGGD